MKRSIPTFSQADVGQSRIIIGSLIRLRLNLWHVPHRLSRCSMSLLTPGQKTVSLALLLHFSTPRWASWILCRVSRLQLCGMTSLFCFRRISSTALRSRYFGEDPVGLPLFMLSMSTCDPVCFLLCSALCFGFASDTGNAVTPCSHVSPHLLLLSSLYFCCCSWEGVCSTKAQSQSCFIPLRLK